MSAIDDLLGGIIKGEKYLNLGAAARGAASQIDSLFANASKAVDAVAPWKSAAPAVAASPHWSVEATRKKFRVPTIAKRGGLAAGYIGAGYLGSAFISNQGEQARAYYGDKEFESRFGSGFDIMAGASKVLGFGLAGAAAMGIDPISTALDIPGRVSKGARYYAASKLKNIYKKSSKNFFNTDYPSRSPGFNPKLTRDAIDKKIRRQDKRMNKNNPYRGLGMAIGVATATAGGMAGAAIGSPMAFAASVAIPTVAVDLGLTALSRGKFGMTPWMMRNKAAVAMTGGGLALGGAMAMNRPNYPAAEGNILSAEYDRESVVKRMNFSTAGLVQALHKNRKVMY